MSRRKTQKEFEEEVSINTNNEYKVIGNYINNHTRIKFKHIKCGTEFETTPKDFLSGKTRCPIQGKENIRTAQLKSTEQFQKDFDFRSKGEYALMSVYKNIRTKISVKHNICGKTFDVNPNNFVNKSSNCPHCYVKNQKKNTEIFKKEVEALEQSEYKIVSEYRGKNIKIRFYHEECGREFEMTPDKFIQGHRCTACSETNGEAKIRKILTKLNVRFSKQYRFSDCRGDKFPLPFDFAIFNHEKLIGLIEYDGEQHFKPVKFNGIDDERANKLFVKNKKRDKIKNDYCKKNNIKLLRIPYWEYENIEKIITNMRIPSQTVYENSGSV